MYDVLVTFFDTKSEVNIWRQTSMTINLSSSTILTYDTRHTTEVYHSSMWSVLEGGKNVFEYNDLCNQWCIFLKNVKATSGLKSCQGGRKWNNSSQANNINFKSPSLQIGA